jgi:hypothetical protein
MRSHQKESICKLDIKPCNRWVFNLDKQYWIWEWARKDMAIQASKTYSLYRTLKERFESPSQRPHDNIFRSEIKSSNTASIIPVIYQPAVDSLKNFLREVYCVSVLCRNKQFRWLNVMYRFLCFSIMKNCAILLLVVC